jgi:hypothetical protein
MSTHVTYTFDLEDFARVKVGEQVTITSIPAGASNVQVHINSRSFVVSYDLLDTPPERINMSFGLYQNVLRDAESKGFREGEAFIKRQIKEKIAPSKAIFGCESDTHWVHGFNYCLEWVLALLPKD